MIQYIKFGQNPSFGPRDRVQTNLFGQNLTFKVLVWPWKWGKCHQNLILSSPCSVVFLCKFGQNPPICSGERVQKMLIFTTIIVWWSWKLGQGHENLIISFNYYNDTIHIVWPESTVWFNRWSADKLLLVKIWNSKFWCDLENEVKVTKI